MAADVALLGTNVWCESVFYPCGPYRDAIRLSAPVIEGFICKDTYQLWMDGYNRRFNAIGRPALRKLMMLDAAVVLDDLRIPPGNRLEALRGGRKGQHSIRINQQGRICFRWNQGPPIDVEITDYH